MYINEPNIKTNVPCFCFCLFVCLTYIIYENQKSSLKKKFSLFASKVSQSTVTCLNEKSWNEIENFFHQCSYEPTYKSANLIFRYYIQLFCFLYTFECVFFESLARFVLGCVIRYRNYIFWTTRIMLAGLLKGLSDFHWYSRVDDYCIDIFLHTYIQFGGGRTCENKYKPFSCFS